MLAVAVMVKLGFWQLERAAEKATLFNDYQEHAEHSGSRPAANLNLLERQPERFEAVTVSGEFDPQRYFFIDNQLHQGTPGYHVVGLLNIANQEQQVAVNLGWIEAPTLRSELPDIRLPSGTVSFTALTQYPQENVFINDVQEQPLGIWPQRIPEFVPSAVADNFQLDIAPFLLLLSKNASFGYLRDWKPNVMPPKKHQAYALQWFSLAVAALVIFTIAVIRINKQKQEE